MGTENIETGAFSLMEADIMAGQTIRPGFQGLCYLIIRSLPVSQNLGLLMQTTANEFVNYRKITF